MRERIEHLRQGGRSWLGDGHVSLVRRSFSARESGIVADRLGIMPNFPIYDDADQIELVKAALMTRWPRSQAVSAAAHPVPHLRAKSQLLSPDEVAASGRDVR